jgi:hypothetical protein
MTRIGVAAALRAGVPSGVTAALHKVLLHRMRAGDGIKRGGCDG